MREQVIEKINKMIENNEIETDLDAESLYDYAFLLTQYEHYGVDYDDIMKLIIHEYLDVSDISYSDWNEYCEENKYYDDIVDILDEEYFNTYYYNNPYKAVQDVINGEVNLSDKYIKCGVFGLESFDDLTDLFSDEFYTWYIENELYRNDDIDAIKNNADAIIAVCMMMVSMGY